MEYDSVWSETDQGRDISTITDDFGNEINEELAPIPPPKLGEEGGSRGNAHVLDRHTGTQTWATKGKEDVHADPFDMDIIRPDSLMNGHASDRIGRVVTLNRTGTNDAPDRDLFNGRGDMYNGYNVVGLKRTPKINVPTNRERSEWLVYGTSRAEAGTRETRVDSVHEPSLKSGVINKNDILSQGRRSNTGDGRSIGSGHVHMGGNGMMQKMDINRGRRSSTGDGKAIGSGHVHMGGNGMMQKMDMNRGRKDIDGRVSQSEIETPLGNQTSLPMNRRATNPVDAGAERGAVPLGNWDGVVNNQTPRSTFHDEQGRIVRGMHVLGNSDSTLAGDVRKITFSQTAAMAAHFCFGEQDSQQSRKSGYFLPDFERSAPLATPGPVLKREPYLLRTPQSDTSILQIRAGPMQRGRDLRIGPGERDRFVPETKGVLLHSAFGSESRSAPEESVRSLDNIYGLGREFDPASTLRASGQSIKLNQKQEMDRIGDDINTMRRASARETIMSTIRSTVGRVIGNKDHTSHLPTRTRESVVPNMRIGGGAVERRLGDDGSLSQTHEPLSGGNIINSATPTPNSLVEGGEERLNIDHVPRVGYSNINAPVGSYTRRGNRE